MKSKFFAFVLISLLSVLSLSAQGMKNRCQNGPMDRTQFQQQKQFIGSRQGVFAQLEAARSLSTSYCLSSEQVKEVAALFQNDFDRLEYAKHAWYSVYDREEFYVVFDAFIQASNLFRLHDFIRNEMGEVKPNSNPNPGPAPVASIQYPDASYYAGANGCTQLINEPGFQQVLASVKNQVDDNSRMNYLKGLWSINCFSVAQTMMIASEFQNESARLQFLKNASTRVFDTGNLNFAAQVFVNQNFRKDWAVFLAGQNTSTTTNTSTPTPQNTCQVSQESMSKIINSLNQQAVNSSRVNLAKQQIQVNKCFTARQVKSIVATISVESGRLEVMKFAYDYTIDKPEYLNILDVLSVQGSRDEIIGMVK